MKRETVKSLKAELAIEKHARQMEERTFRISLQARDLDLREARHACDGAHEMLTAAGKHFEFLRTQVSLIRQVAENAERVAGHMAGAYSPATAMTPNR